MGTQYETSCAHCQTPVSTKRWIALELTEFKVSKLFSGTVTMLVVAFVGTLRKGRVHISAERVL